MSERIDIKPPSSLSKQKIIELKEFYVEIHENYIRHIEKFLAEEPISEDDDESLGRENIINDVEIIILKNRISGIDKTYVQKEKSWKIGIQATGFGYDIYIYIKLRNEAENLFQKLLDYLSL